MLLLALALAAQAAPPPEPRYLRISFNPRNWDDTLIRTAAPSGKVDLWFKPDGAAVKAINALPAASFPYANGTFTVDAEGKVSECAPETRFEKSPEAIAFAGALCADLRAHGRFVPSLDASGHRVAATMGLFARASDKRSLWGEGGDNPPLVGAMPLPPAPPAPPAMWMPSYDTGTYSIIGLREFSGDRRLIATGALTYTGVKLSADAAGKTVCVVARSSGDTRNDAKACKVAGKYKLADNGSPSRYKSGAMVMMVHDGNKPIGLLPTLKRGVGPRLTAIGTARIAAIIGKPVDDDALAKRISASIGRDGIATRCSITGGDGNDTADLALCRALKSEILFTPAQDIFGLPSSGWL